MRNAPCGILQLETRNSKPETVPGRARLARQVRRDVFGQSWAGASLRGDPRRRRAAATGAASGRVPLRRRRPAPALGAGAGSAAAFAERAFPSVSAQGPTGAKPRGGGPAPRLDAARTLRARGAK